MPTFSRRLAYAFVNQRLQVEFAIDPRVRPGRDQGEEDAHLAHFHFAQSPIVLATGTGAISPAFWSALSSKASIAPDLKLGVL